MQTIVELIEAGALNVLLITNGSVFIILILDLIQIYVTEWLHVKGKKVYIKKGGTTGRLYKFNL
jgi:hypothetical protein